MIAGTELVATEEPSLPRMSDGEDNDDLYDSDAPSEESERDEDSPQGSRVDLLRALVIGGFCFLS